MFSHPSRIFCTVQQNLRRRKKKHVLVLFVLRKKENIKHLAENSFQRNLGVTGGPSAKSLWASELSKDYLRQTEKWNLERIPPTCCSFLQVYWKCWQLDVYWVADLDYEMRTDPQSLRQSRNKGLLQNELNTREISQ